MTLEEKVGQMIFAGLPAEDRVDIAREYHLGGYVMFGNDFAGCGLTYAKERQRLLCANCSAQAV